MRTTHNRLAALLVGLTCMLAWTSTARAQCSSWVNTFSIASYLGGEAVLINAELSDGSAFIFWVSTVDEFVAFTVDLDGVKELKNWEEDEYGTGKLSDNTGQTCWIGCNEQSGVYVTITGDDFITETFEVTATGDVAHNWKTITSKPCASPVTCKSCGITCDGVWMEVGTCGSNQSCCGYAECVSGGVSGQNSCCYASQTCKNTPPNAVQCVSSSSP